MTAKEKNAARGPSKKAIVVGVAGLIVGLAASPKLLPGGGSEMADGTTTTLFERGPTVMLPEITLNLADGSLLRVGLALQMPYDPNGGEAESDGAGEGDEEEIEDPTKGHAQDLDAAISVFSVKTMAELLDELGRESARAELLARIAQHHEELTIEDVLFYQFVMQ